MPKQVWQSEDGSTFESEDDCILYEKVNQDLNELFSTNSIQAEKRLGFQTGFEQYLSKGFYDAAELWKYKQSIIKLAKMLDS